MFSLLYVPHGFIRRHLPRVERGITALSLAGLVYVLITSLPVFPPFWDGAIVAAVFLTTLASPFVGFSLAVLAAFYPISTISIYLAAIFLAIAILAMRPLTQHLGATVLVMSAPLLSGYSLGWVIPLLGGLWWGASAGSWIGSLAAFWGMLAAGMAGLNPDWLAHAGQVPPMVAVVERFAGANSLEALRLLVTPLAPDTTALLYNLLQIAVWGIVATVAGNLNDRPNVQNRRPLGGALIALVGGFTLLGAHLLFAYWLGQPAAESLDLRIGLMAAATTGVMAAALVMLQDFFEHPLPRPKPRKPRPAESAPPEPVTGPEPVSPPTQYPPFDPKKQKSQEDLILLELDEE
ncbi:MAG TPA: hypothetical protein PK530_14495 [Anaerolineales bacterium]|nr:hypothetical protein [Anaerolineales bacterium]